jgi:IclR family pca regulon transcriptional regulator
MQQRVMSIGLNVGSRLPVYCSSMGRVLLAALPEDEARRRLQAVDRIARTNKTITDLDELMTELQQVRVAGFAINDQELELGLRSIAIPVYNTTGKVVAALNVGVQAASTTTKQLKTDVLPQLQQEQIRLRELLP